MLTNFIIPDFYPAMAEVFILGMACLLLMLGLFAKRFNPSVIAYLAVATLLSCGVITWVTADPQVVLTFSHMYVDDPLSDFLKILLYVAVAAMLIYGRGYLQQRSLDKPEYYVLVLFATLGMMVMISSAHMLAIYLGLEMLSLSLYALVAIDRDSTQTTEAAMKYFVLGALASGMLLYGMSMIYGATGQLEIGGVAQALRNGEINLPVLVLGLVFIVAGLAFKLGAVPFHMWIPDVYQGAPTPVTLFIASAPKLAAFAMVMRLLVYGMFDLARQWQVMFLILALLSIALGNLAAIAQRNLKRMLAYSAISHMGFMLLALTSGVVGAQRSFDVVLNAYSSALYYTVAYVLMSLAGFGMILLLSRAGHEAENLDDFKGLNKRSPWFAAMMMFVMFSQAGLPFFVGFFAKLSVLMAVIVAGYLWVAVFAVAFSLVGAFYYLRVVKLMYFDKPEDASPIVASLDMRIVLSANAIAIAVFGIYPHPIMWQCTQTLLRSL